MIKNITIVSCHSRVGGNLDTCFRRYDTKFVSPNSIGFTIELDTDIYKARHLIENFFAKLKQYGAIATRYDKTAQNFLGAIHLAASVILLN